MFSHRTMVTTIVSGVSFLLVVLLGGCANTMRNEQLARVAKDWSLVVRASQVIPVYPLTEDLVPGDIFLVRMSIPQQHREYQKRGFLPMDMHLTRLHELDYAGLYLGSYGTQGNSNTPYHWQFPPDGKAPTTVKDLQSLDAVESDTGVGSKPQPRRHMDSTLWPTAPRAAFPSYTFQVDSRGGIQAALPIQGVPVALSMMQTDKAFGSVTLSDAYTYGVPYDKLIQSVTEWAENPKNRLTLMQIRRGVSKGNTWFSVLDDLKKFFLCDKNERTVYLRVISRVYVVGSVTVALINTQKGAADAQIGAARNIEMLNPALQAPTKPRDSSQPADLAWDPNKAATNFQKALEAVNTNLGGAVKLQWATARSVALDETFPRPLVIGYLGFDFPIDNSGFLQCPIATHYQLESTGGSSRITMPMDTPTPERLRDRIERWLGQDPKANEPKLESWLKAQTPPEAWRSSKGIGQERLESAVRDLKIPE